MSTMHLEDSVIDPIHSLPRAAAVDESKDDCGSTTQEARPSGFGTWLGRLERPGLLSALWVFAMFNYLYADVEGLMDASFLKQYMSGQVGGFSITQNFLLSAAVLMEVPIAMTLLSKVLPYRANRWANISAGALKTLVVAATLFVGKPSSYYMFFASIEIMCTALIVVLAWTWTRPSLDSRLPTG